MFSLWSLAVIFCLVWFLVLVGLLCKPYWCHLWGTEQYSVWGRKPLALVPLYHEVEARESQRFTTAVEMSCWDCSLGLASGQGNKKVRSLFLCYWEIHHSPSLSYGTEAEMAETWLLPLLLVSWVINRGSICGKLLEVPY